MSDGSKKSYYLVDCRQDCKHVCNFLLISAFIILAAVVVTYQFRSRMPAEYTNINKNYRIHVTCCINAYLIGIGLFLLSFTGNNFLGRRTSRYAKGLIHGVFSSIATLLAIYGVHYAKTGKTTMRKIKNENHTSAGWVAIYSICFPLLLGVALYICKASMSTKLRVVVKMVHILTGLTAYLAGVVAIHYSFDYPWIKKNPSFRANTAIIYKVATIIFVILTVIFTLHRLFFLIIFLRGRGRK